MTQKQLASKWFRFTAPTAGPALTNSFSWPEGLKWDRKEHECKEAAWLSSQWSRPDSRTILLGGSKVVLQYPAAASSEGAKRKAAALAYYQGQVPYLSEAKKATARNGPFFLGCSAEGIPHFVAPAKNLAEEEEVSKHLFVNHKGEKVGAKLVGLRAVGGKLSPFESALVAHAKSLLEWHKESGFCSKCGTRTEVKDGGRSVICTVPNCRKEAYPRTNPVAIMMVISPCGNKCLVGQTKERHVGNFYSVLAGFVDQGESLENAVRRETMEEAGVPVGEVQYHSSQPWPFSSNLMLGCFAQALTDEINFDPREMHMVKWATKEEISAALKGELEELMVPPRMALAHQLMKSWVQGDFPILADKSDSGNNRGKSHL